jgi:hypothetical protein
LSRERCISSGGRDKTVRLWKIVEESQLVFRSGGSSIKKIPTEFGNPVFENSIDVVTLINEDHFVSGGDNGYFFIAHPAPSMILTLLSALSLCGVFNERSPFMFYPMRMVFIPAAKMVEYKCNSLTGSCPLRL